MHLHEARLCLDCEELHTLDRCPHCASDAFAFLTRWIPANDQRRAVPRKPIAPRPSRRSRWLTGAVGIAALAAAQRWIRRPPAQPSASDTKPR
jgi:hypothetical protein